VILYILVLSGVIQSCGAEESAQEGITGGPKQIEQQDRPLFDGSSMMQDEDFEPRKLSDFKKKKPNFGGLR
jgi:hypothetical protein